MSLSRDGFVIEATNDTVRIFGNDDDVPGGDISKTCWYGKEAQWQPHFRRGTLFGVYEFLERYAGVRMYFPGELGTVVPCAGRLAVPEGRLEKAPAFRYRRYGFEDGPQKQEFKLLNWYRLRMETETMKCVHGQRRLHLYERFGKTHPEYFANHQNKHVRERVRAKGHLCHSSKVWDEIKKDALKYFVEGGADTFDLMPQDGMTPVFRCNCPNCAAAYSKDRQYATDLIWRHTAEVAAHVKGVCPQARSCPACACAFNPPRRATVRRGLRSAGSRPRTSTNTRGTSRTARSSRRRSSRAGRRATPMRTRTAPSRSTNSSPTPGARRPPPDIPARRSSATTRRFSRTSSPACPTAPSRA